MMLNMMKKFVVSEDGAVTVDWVFLTAAIVGLGIGVVLQLHDSTSNVASSVSDAVAAMPVGTP
jgi:hypothetical protein